MPSLLLILTAMVVFIYIMHCQYWGVYYSFLFCLSSHHSFLPFGRIYPGGRSWALNDSSSSNLCVFFSWLLLTYLLCRTQYHFGYSPCFKLWSRLQAGPRISMLEFLLPMLPFFLRLTHLQGRECGARVHCFLNLLLRSCIEKADKNLHYYALYGVYRWKLN